jgi:hypothetical protein
VSEQNSFITHAVLAHGAVDYLELISVRCLWCYDRSL